ncbi:MAG: BACON domain-containing protein, partial [Blastocatellia bacterium]
MELMAALEVQGSGCTFTITPTGKVFSKSGGPGTIGVTAGAGCGWTATTANAWITITSGASGSGDGMVSYWVADNTGPARTGSITVAGQTYTVMQDDGCGFMLSPSSQSFFAGGGVGQVEVGAGAGCGWTAASNAAWIMITSGASGSGDGYVDYTISVNTGPPRSGMLTIAGQAFTITQSDGCAYSISSSSQTFPPGGGAGSVAVTAAAECAWAAASSDSWITITSGGSGTGNGSVAFSVAPNSSLERFGRMTIAGRLVAVRQGTDCTFTLTPLEQNFSAGGGTGTIDVGAAGGCAWSGAVVVNTPPELPRAYVDTTDVPPTGQTIEVPAGGDFQAALDLAQPGDVITLQAGAAYTGNFTLPVKSGSGWIVIRTSAPDGSLPAPDARITPAYANVLPKILTPNVEPAIEARNGAHHYRFIGVEIAPAPTAPFVYNLVLLGEGEASLAQVPHDLILDRVYIHGSPTFTLRRGIALNSASTAIINSHISDCHEVGVDSQAIGGWNGPGPFKIVNNYLEGAGENVIFGGSDPMIPNLTPSDIEFRRNYCFKPLSWRISDPGYAGMPWGVKNLFELKNAQRILIDGNIFEHNWTMAQNGFAILFTVRNQDGTAPWSVVQDVTFTNNIVRGVAGGFNLLGMDNNNPSLPTRRIRIANNLLDEVDGQRWDGGGIAFQFVNGPGDITIENNTILHTGNVIAAGDIPSEEMIFRDNLFPHNLYGIKGDERDFGNATIQTYLPGSLVRRNVMVAGPIGAYPPENFFPASFAEVMFLDFAGRNYRLASASPYNNAGTNGRDIGADFDALDAAQSGSAPIVAGGSNAPWITITSGANGAGAGAVGYSVEPNTGSWRMGTMLIAGTTFTVIQDSGCGITLDSSSQSFSMSGGTGAIGVSAAANCSWRAVSNDPWITVVSGSGGSGNDTVNYAVSANPGPLRTGTLTIEGQVFTVTQASGCSFTLSPANQNFPSNGGASSVGVTTVAGCAWTAASNDAWLTITSGSSGTGNGTVNYSVGANPGPSRTGTLTIAGQAFTVTQGSGCTYAISPTSQSFLAGGGGNSVEVTTVAACAWTAASNDAWVTITSGSSGTGNG